MNELNLDAGPHDKPSVRIHVSSLVRSVDRHARVYSVTLNAAPFQTRKCGHRHPRGKGAVHADQRALTSFAGAADYQLSFLLSLRSSRGSSQVHAHAHGEGEQLQ